jgi:molybdopterin-guanine dinucleotide biosynthesis protein A
VTGALGSGVTALVLAGKRDGSLDPLAASAGVTHKCLVPVRGKPLIEYPLSALTACQDIERIVISIDDPEALRALPTVAALEGSGRLTIVAAQHNLVDSVVAASRTAGFPMLITTADNALLSPAAVADFVGAAQAQTADVAVAFASREAVLAAHPDGQRRFYAFRCGSYSNCNLYWLRSPTALAAAEVFRSGGQFAKHPKRILRAFGLLNLIRFRLGIGTLDAAFRRLSNRFRLNIQAVVLRDGRLAIDVDNLRTKNVAEEILAREAA